MSQLAMIEVFRVWRGKIRASQGPLPVEQLLKIDWWMGKVKVPPPAATAAIGGNWRQCWRQYFGGNSLPEKYDLTKWLKVRLGAKIVAAVAALYLLAAILFGGSGGKVGGGGGKTGGSWRQGWRQGWRQSQLSGGSYGGGGGTFPVTCHKLAAMLAAMYWSLAATH
ncbi:hypothetical protein C8R43DRAFT_960766 [Mycena crocata]|nr:hypothetical protein C8R43DRAFT_960766 [Mycena crocata]